MTWFGIYLVVIFSLAILAEIYNYFHGHQKRVVSLVVSLMLILQILGVIFIGTGLGI